MLPIKRQKFSQSIRKITIQNIKRQLRFQLLNESLSQLDRQKFVKLYDTCKQNQFDQESCKTFICYLSECKIVQFQLKKIFKVITNYLCQFGRQNKQYQKKLSTIVLKVVQIILDQEEQMKKYGKIQQKSNQQGLIVQYLFQEIIDCMQAGYFSSELFSVWQQIFCISHFDISLKLFCTFNKIITSPQFEFNPYQINTVISAMYQFSKQEFSSKINIQLVQTILKTFEAICIHYQLGQKQILKTLNCIKNIILVKQEIILKTRVSRLVELRLFVNIKLYLNDQNIHIAKLALQIIVKIFSLKDNEGMFDSILMQNPDFLDILRKLLPVKCQSFKKSYSQGQMNCQDIIQPYNNEILNLTIVAISNIVGSNQKMVDVVILSGIFNILKSLFNNTSSSIRCNISYVLYNICIIGNNQQIDLLIQQFGLLDILLALIKEQLFQDAVSNGLAIFRNILVNENAKIRRQNIMSYKNQKKSQHQLSHAFIRNQISLLKFQYQQCLNSFLFYNDKLSKEAQTCLQLLQQTCKNVC